MCTHIERGLSNHLLCPLCHVFPGVHVHYSLVHVIGWDSVAMIMGLYSILQSFHKCYGVRGEVDSHTTCLLSMTHQTLT